MDKQWYVVNTYSGHESKVKEKLDMKMKSTGMEQHIFRVVVPEEKIVETKNGVTKERTKKLFPGYILIEMDMSDEAWYIVRNTPGVTGFIGSSGKGAKPVPLMPYEVDKILNSMGMSRIELGSELKEKDKVKIITGAFENMYGEIESIDVKQQKLTILVDLFGQSTPVEVGLNEIEKA